MAVKLVAPAHPIPSHSTVLVESFQYNDGVRFEAQITAHHDRGYYVKPSTSTDGRVYITFDEVVGVVEFDEYRMLDVGSVASLGSEDGPIATVIAITQKGFLIGLNTEFGDHIMEVTGDDLVRSEKS